MSEVLPPSGPWTIKSISKQVAHEITATARQNSSTAGKLVENMWRTWPGNEASVAGTDIVPVQARASNAIVSGAGVSQQQIADLALLLSATGPFTEHNPMPGAVRSLLNKIARNITKE